MIKTTAAYRRAIKKNRVFHHKIKISFEDNTVLTADDMNIFSLQISDATSNTDTFDVGAAIAKELTLKLNNIDSKFDGHSFNNAAIAVEVGLEVEDGSIEWLNKGVFNAEPGVKADNTISVNAFDNMVKFDRAYTSSTLAYPATLGAIVRDACSCCEVPLAPDTATFDGSNYVVQNRPNDAALTFRNILQFVGQITCKFFKINAAGKLTVGWYDIDYFKSIDAQTDIEIDKTVLVDELQNGSTIQTEDIVITGIRVVEDAENNSDVETIYKSGTDEYALKISQNKLIQEGKGAEIAKYLGKCLNGLQFRPASVKVSPDPSYESGDIGIIVDAKNNYYKTIFTNVEYIAHAAQSLTCAAEAPARLSSARYSQPTRVYKEIRADARKYKKEWELSFDELEKAMKEQKGLYLVIKITDVGDRLFYLCDHPTLEESEVVFELNREGWGVSTDGGETWNAGLLVDGTMITKILNTIGINADWINTGSLTVKDDDGNIVFQVDIDSKTATLSGDLFLGGKNNKRGILKILDTNGKVKTLIDKDGIRHFDSSQKAAPYHYRSEHCVLKISEKDFVGGGQSICTAEVDFMKKETTLSEEFWAYFLDYGADAMNITANIRKIVSPGAPSSNGIYALGTFGIKQVSLFLDDVRSPNMKISVECSYINYGFNNLSPRYIKPKEVYVNVDVTY